MGCWTVADLLKLILSHFRIARARVGEGIFRVASPRYFLWKPALVLSFFAMAIFCSAKMAPAQPAFPLHTAGQYIVDSNGNRVRLNAVNWYGAESTDFVVAGLEAVPLQSIVQQIKSLGFNAVRLPWSNQLYESNPVVPGYALTANPNLEAQNALTVLDQVIGALTDAGIMVILDDHNSDAEWCCSNTDGNSLWYNTRYPETNWIADWQGMVQRYHDNPWVIGADLRNEPRADATWGGVPATDWHSAAERGGNAVLSANPNLLIFVGGVGGGADLSGASSLPVQLNIANHLVYSPHDYGFYYSGLSGFDDYVGNINPRWGYLVTGSNPQPVWIGEFGTCDTSDTCVTSDNSSDLGYWFNFFTAFVQQYNLDWSYWAVNGTQSTGSGRTYGAPEGYGILNVTWSGTALPSLASQLGTMITAAPSFAIIPNGTINIAAPGQNASSTITIVPQSGFMGTVGLSCSVSGGAPGTANQPTCTVPSSVTVAGIAAATTTLTIQTTGSGAGASSFSNQLGIFSRALGGITAACVLFIGIPAGRRSRLLMFFAFLAMALSVSGCGGGDASQVNRGTYTPLGTYTVTVSGTSANLGPVKARFSVNVE